MDVVNLSKQHPSMYQQVIELNNSAEAAAAGAGLDPLLVDLVKIRVSQLNGCAFCLRMHSREAMSKGESADRLAVIAAWWESQYFTDAERAALALAEDVTGLPVPDQQRWDTGALNAEQVSAVSWIAIVMNTWNRLAVRSHYPVAPEPTRSV
ncbi:MAG: carboxymuconolactone decarboxylase family protein [Gordonia sp. (in: high G+C Gram-positive bacteria)]|uniref:carboxymuconolactone decarboxylase family protein n=1 Tax=Gordonia TaxID=2053 RepID=UPI0032642050